MRIQIFLLFICVLFINGCTGNSPVQPTLDMNGIQSILPTVDPDRIRDYAQLADDDTLASGQTLYEANCAECHGIDGEGQFPDAPTQRDETGRIGAPPHNGGGHTWHHPDDVLLKIINNGGTAPADMFYPMPAFGETLGEDDIAAILAYIKSMWSEEQRLIQAERSLQADQ